MKRNRHLIVGTGYGAQFVIKFVEQLYGTDVEVELATRNVTHAKRLLSEFPHVEFVGINDVHGVYEAVWLAVPDAYIAHYAQKLPVESNEWIHLSGATPLEALAPHHTDGLVVWPVISLASPYRLDEVPIAVESHTHSGLAALIREKFPKTTQLTYQERLTVHAAAVVANNFVHHLHALLEDEMNNKHIDREILVPLLMQTHARLLEGNLKISQTGPARRGDTITIEKHLQLIESSQLSEIYKTISQSIQSYYATKL